MQYVRVTLIGLAVGMTVWALDGATHAQTVAEQLAVTVVDRDGTPVTTLTASDFVVTEDDVEREILSVQRDTEPKQIALLVDTSQAAGRAIGDFRRGAEAFVDAMHEGNELSIITFGGTPRILANASHDAEQLAQGLSEIFSYSATASYLLDAAVETTKGFDRRGANRPVIVVLSTLGLDYSNMDDRTAIGRLVDAGVALHAVVLTQSAGVAANDPTFSDIGPPSLLDQGPAGRPFGSRNIERDRFLTAGPRATGGRRHDLLLSTSAEQVLRLLAAQIQGQYVVEYSRPSTLIPPKRIEIDVRQGDLDARGVPVPTGKGADD